MCFKRKPTLGHYNGTREEWIAAYRRARQDYRVSRDPDSEAPPLLWKAALIVHSERQELCDPLVTPVTARLEAGRLINEILEEEQAARRAGAIATDQATDYRVTLYATVRVPVEVSSAANPLNAVELAIKNTELEHAFRGGEYADDITAALVDVVGDANYQRSVTFLPGPSNDEPWAESPADESEQPIPSRAAEILKFLYLSTCHLSKRSFDWVRRAAASNGDPRCPGLHIGSYAYGVFISVPSDIRDLTEIATMQCPGDLKSVLGYARSLGCELIRMDADAPCVDALPTYDW